MNVQYNGIIFDDTVRRQQLQNSRYNGIDYLEVDTTPGITNQRLLRVYFIPPGPDAASNKVTAMLDDLAADLDAFAILGGEKIRHIRVQSVTRGNNHHLRRRTFPH